MSEIWFVSILMKCNEYFYSREEVEEFIDTNYFNDFDKKNCIIEKYVLSEEFNFKSFKK